MKRRAPGSAGSGHGVVVAVVVLAGVIRTGHSRDIIGRAQSSRSSEGSTRRTQKLLGWFGGDGYRATMDSFTKGMGIPALFAILPIIVEFFGSLALILGLVTRLVALGLMLGGVFGFLNFILGFYSNVAIAWIGAVVADLVNNKPFLKVSPSYVEFKQAHLYQIIPVGFFSMIAGSAVAIPAYFGFLGEFAGAFSPYLPSLSLLSSHPSSLS